MLWQINRVRVNRCVYRCVSAYGGVRQRVVITVSKGNVCWRALFCLDRMESLGVHVKRAIVNSIHLLKVCFGCES